MRSFGWINGTWVLAITLGLTGASWAPPVEDQGKESSTATKAKVQAAYGKLPLSFEINQGQSNKQVKFLSRGKGYTLFLTPTEAVFTLVKPHKNSLQPHQTKQTDQAILRMQLVDANPAPQIVGVDKLPGKSNYFIGNNPQRWHTGIPHYARVKYQDLYPGIDLVFYGNQRQLEYDFVVAPGADPQAIKLAFDGLIEGDHRGSPLRIDNHGDLILRTAGGEVRLHKPQVYQELNGSKQIIPGTYVLHPLPEENPPPSPLPSGESQGEGNYQVGFQVAAYDTTRTLIIDPVLSYSTYLGGSHIDYGYAIAVDTFGSAYVTGETFSEDFPTPLGAFQRTPGGLTDAFVAKLNAEGNALVYSTYLGGSSTDTGWGIVADTDGNAYVTGGTSSADFPTTPEAFQTASDSGGAFVTKLNATGTALAYSTYLGSGGAAGLDITTEDAGGSVCVTGSTPSGFPTTADAFQRTPGGGVDAFVTKVNSEGTALLYSTYLGGSGSDLGHGIALDGGGNAYVTGETGSSADFPTTPEAVQNAYGSGTSDAFVTKVNSDGTGLVYSTYLGGSGADIGTDIAVDASNNAYVTGTTASIDFPTAIPFQAAHGGGGFDAFVTKLNDRGTVIAYSTYLGGSGFENCCGIAALLGGIAVDASENAYVAGTTDSDNFPTTDNALQGTLGGDGGFVDAFVTKLSTTVSVLAGIDSALLYSTYLGGSDIDRGYGIAMEADGNIYVTGGTSSADFPTAGSIQAFDGAFADVFVAKISETGDGGEPGCALTLSVANPELLTGETLEFTLALQHNRWRTVTVPLKLWVETAAGEEIGMVYEEVHTLETGDRIDLSDSIELPAELEPGLYHLKVDIREMNGIGNERVSFWVKQ